MEYTFPNGKVYSILTKHAFPNGKVCFVSTIVYFNAMKICFPIGKVDVVNSGMVFVENEGIGF
jgi:hypothetical protein